MKLIDLSLSILLSFAAVACTTQADDGTTPPGASCGNDVCEAGESHDSCPADCDSTAPVCDNDGTCEAGESTSTCAADCPATGGDEPIPADELDDVCTSYKKAGREIFSCLADPYLAGQPTKAWYVGFAISLDINAYEDGEGQEVQKVTRSDGRQAYEIDVTGADPAEDLEMTYISWSGGSWRSGTLIWAMYPDSTVVNGGRFRECGWRNNIVSGQCKAVYACGMFLKRSPGHRPVPLGYYLPRNECSNPVP